jgi:hypothetical protein
MDSNGNAGPRQPQPGAHLQPVSAAKIRKRVLRHKAAASAVYNPANDMQFLKEGVALFFV